jgi:hypothetical protein
VSESKTVTAVHEKTKLVQVIPRSYLTIYPDFRELNGAAIVERQRGKERKMFGETITPAPKPKAVTKPVAAHKEGGK